MKKELLFAGALTAVTTAGAQIESIDPSGRTRDSLLTSLNFDASIGGSVGSPKRLKSFNTNQYFYHAGFKKDVGTGNIGLDGTFTGGLDYLPGYDGNNRLAECFASYSLGNHSSAIGEFSSFVGTHQGRQNTNLFQAFNIGTLSTPFTLRGGKYTYSGEKFSATGAVVDQKLLFDANTFNSWEPGLAFTFTADLGTIGMRDTLLKHGFKVKLNGNGLKDKNGTILSGGFTLENDHGYQLQFRAGFNHSDALKVNFGLIELSRKFPKGVDVGVFMDYIGGNQFGGGAEISKVFGYEDAFRGGLEWNARKGQLSSIQAKLISNFNIQKQRKKPAHRHQAGGQRR